MIFKIGVIHTPPFATNCAENSTCPSRGYGVDVTELLCKFLNLTCSFIWYPGSDYGDADENGRGTGLIGAIESGRFDASLPIVIPTVNRFQLVAFTHTYFYLDVVLATRAPDFNSVNLNWNLLYAFQWPIFVAFFSALFLIAILMVFFNSTSRLLTKMPMQKTVSVLLLSNFFDNSAQLITKRYKPSAVRSNAVRIVLAFWTLVAVVLGSAYTGILFSQKVSSNINYPFVDLDTFSECLENKLCRFIMPTTSVAFYTQLIASDTVWSRRLKLAVQSNPVLISPLDKIPQAIVNEKNVFLVWLWTRQGVLYGLNGDPDCAFYLIDLPYNYTGGGASFAIRKDSSALAALSDSALTFRENGLVHAVQQKYVQANVCNGKANLRKSASLVNEGAKLVSLRIVFYVFVFGIATALAALAIEKALAILKRTTSALINLC